MRVLIFTASTGNGHNSCARYVKEKIAAENAGAEIMVVDAFKQYTSKLRAWIFEKGYFFACNHLVGAHNYFFKKAESDDRKHGYKNGANGTARGFEYGMLKTIDGFKPNLIVSTYIFCTVALNNIERYYKLPCKIAAIALDYGVSPYWGSCAESLDYMFITNEGMIGEFLKRGFKREQLIVSGVPVSEEFYPASASEKEELRVSLGLDARAWTITVMKASFFHLPIKKLVSELFLIDGECQIIIINGRDERSKRKIDRLVAKNQRRAASLDKNNSGSSSDKKIINLAYTSDVAKYMRASDLVIGKAGGLSVTETVKTGLPSLIIDKLPQQEIYNKRYLIDCGCALGVTENTIAECVNRLKNDCEYYNSMRENVLAQRREKSIDKIYSVLADVPAADYSAWNFSDDKRKALANIKNATKSLT